MVCELNPTSPVNSPCTVLVARILSYAKTDIFYDCGVCFNRLTQSCSFKSSMFAVCRKSCA